MKGLSLWGKGEKKQQRWSAGAAAARGENTFRAELTPRDHKHQIVE